MKNLISIIIIICFISCGENKSSEEYISIALEKFDQCQTGFGEGYNCDKKGIFNNISKALKVNPNYAQAYYLRSFIRNKFDGSSIETINDLEKYIELAPKDKNLGDGSKVLSNSTFTLSTTGKYKPQEEMFVYALLELSKGKWDSMGFLDVDRDYWLNGNKGTWDNTEHIKSLGDSNLEFKEMIKKALANFKKIFYSRQKSIFNNLSNRNIQSFRDIDESLFNQLAEKALELENFNDKDTYRSKEDKERGTQNHQYILVAHDSLINEWDNNIISKDQDYMYLKLDRKLYPISIKEILGKKPDDIIDTLDLGIFANRSIFKDRMNYLGEYAVVKINSIDENRIGNVYMPWPYEATLKLAKLHYDNCDLKNAFKTIDKAIEMNPDRYEAYSIRGDWYLPKFPRNKNDELTKPSIFYSCFKFGLIRGEDPKEGANWYASQGNEKLFSKEKAFFDYAKVFEINSNFENIFNEKFGTPQQDGTYNRLSIKKDSISGEVKVSFKDWVYKKPPPIVLSCVFAGQREVESSGKIVTGQVVLSDKRIVYSYMDKETQRTGSVTYIFDENCSVINIIF